MHSTNDLRAALRQLADAAPETVPLPGDHDELLPAARHARHRSAALRFGAPALAAAMVAGVIAGAVTLSSGAHRAAQPGNSPAQSRRTTPVSGTSVKGSPLLTAVFDVKGLPGMTVGGPSINAASQNRYLSPDGFRTDSDQQAIVRVWEPGRWTPSRPAGAQDVTINGKPGFYGKITDQWMASGGGKMMGLAWQYAPGAWAAVMRGKTTTKADLVRIASAVRTGLHIPVRVPFRLSGLPAGGKLAGIGCDWGPYQSKGCDLTFDYPGGHGQLTLVVNGLAWSEGGTPTTIGGRPAWEESFRVAVAGPGVSEAWVYSTTAHLGKDEMRSILAGLTFASNVKDPTTWFDATTALP